MDILIVYATYSDGTREVAEEVASLLKEKGYQITVQNVIDSSKSGNYTLHVDTLFENIKSHDLVLLGSCTWFEDGEEGQMHSGFRMFQNELHDRLFDGIPFAVFGLGDSNYVHFCRAVDQLEELVTHRRGVLVTPSLRINRYFSDLSKAKQEVKKWVAELLTALAKKPKS